VASEVCESKLNVEALSAKPWHDPADKKNGGCSECARDPDKSGKSFTKFQLTSRADHGNILTLSYSASLSTSDIFRVFTGSDYTFSEMPLIVVIQLLQPVRHISRQAQHTRQNHQWHHIIGCPLRLRTPTCARIPRAALAGC
jgi:hypothetical protein